MKINLSSTVLAAVLGLALAGVSVNLQAQTTNTPAATKPAKVKTAKANTIEYKGTLTAIDTAANTITVGTSKSDATKTLTLTVAATTKFKSDAPALTDFAVGDKVSGSYTKDASGTMTAYSIHKKKMAKSTAATTTAPVTPSATPAPMAAPAPGTTPAAK